MIKKIKKYRAELLIAGFILAVVALFALFVLWTDRNLDFWISYFKGAPVDINILWSLLLNFTGPLVLIGNVLGEIARHLI